jgi:hypothetical protein
MPTQNRRVATYLPPHIDEPFKIFKSQRDIKGDSEALIAILSEYLQVSQEVAYPSSSNLLQRIEVIEERLGSLKSELLSELKSDLELPALKQKSESLSGLQGNLLISHDLPLQPVQSEVISNLESDSKSSSLIPLNGRQLSERLGVHKDSVAKVRQSHKGDSKYFFDWSKAKDPNGIAWEYHEDDKLYHPVLKENPLEYPQTVSSAGALQN